MRKILKISADIFLLLIITFVSIASISTLVNKHTSLFNYSLVTVQSRSMEASHIYVGDIYIIRTKNKYEKGDVIAFKQQNGIWFHEVIDFNQETNRYITKGSSNVNNDGDIGVSKDDILGAKCSNLNLKILNNGIFKIILLIVIYCAIMLAILFEVFKTIDHKCVPIISKATLYEKIYDIILYALISVLVVSNIVIAVKANKNQSNTMTISCGIFFEAIVADDQYLVYNDTEAGDTITGYDNNSGETEIIIPEERNGVTITTIESGVFNNNSTVELIDIPATITKIGHFNFLLCDNLSTIIVRSDIPPEWTSWLGWQLGPNVKIYVPDSSVNAYKKANGWSKYKNQIYKLSQYQQ